MDSTILSTGSSSDYELLDSGDGDKLERFGKYVLSRPDPQALWQRRLGPEEWKKADGVFTRDDKKGEWTLKKDMEDAWKMDFADLKFRIKPTAFKHTGLFPEQSPNWEWMAEKIKKQEAGSKNGEPVEVLNLFAYTGGATLACAKAGAKVVHIDGSKTAIAWARENAELSGLSDKPVRWILEDARAFVKREIKRGNKYQGIIMDPPAFGHGPDNEIWKIEEHFLPLLEDCFALLADEPLFFLVNGYAAGYSALAYRNALLPLVAKFGGNIETGELVIIEAKEAYHQARVLPCGIFARWSK